MDETPLLARKAKPQRPGWPEILAATAAFGILLFALPGLITLLPDDAVVRGLVLGALSGTLGLAAFYAAFALRIRRHAPFGVRGTSAKWLILGAVWGLGAFVITRVIVIGLALLGLDLAALDPQGDYRAAAGGGALALTLSILLLGVLTPIGEEFAFRGVLTNALRRYGAGVSVIGSAVVFGLAHGINLALVPALTVGVIAAILFLRSDSVWPGVLTHAVNNTLGVVAPVVLTALVPAS